MSQYLKDADTRAIKALLVDKFVFILHHNLLKKFYTLMTKFKNSYSAILFISLNCCCFSQRYFISQMIFFFTLIIDFFWTFVGNLTKNLYPNFLTNCINLN